MCKLVLFVASFFIVTFSFAQKNDIEDIHKKIKQSEQLEFVDPLLARDISYNVELKLMGKVYHLLDDSTIKTFNTSEQALINLWGETELVHAKNHYWLGYYNAAKHIYDKSIRAFSIIDTNSLKIAECLARQAIILNKQGESQSALKNTLRAKKIYAKHNMIEELDWCEVIISSCYFMQDKTEEARKRCGNAIKNLEKINSSSIYLLNAYLIYTQFFVDTRVHLKNPKTDYSTCKKAIEQAIVLATKLKNKPLGAYAQKLKADVLFNQKDIDKALEINRSASKILRQSNFLYHYVEAKRSEGQFLMTLKKNEEAIDAFQPAITIASENAFFNELYFMFTHLSSIYASMGNTRDATIYASRAYTYFDHISKPKKEYEMEALEAKYDEEKQMLIAENAKKEVVRTKNQQLYLIVIIFIIGIAATALLYLFFQIKKNKTQIEGKNIELETIAKKNELLLREIHHRVKNNLQIISSLLELQTQKTTDKESISVMLEGQNRVQAMALIHKKLYQNNDLAQIDFQEYIEELCASIHHVYQPKNKHIKYTIKANNFYFDIDTAIPLGLILNELITNAYKHGFKDVVDPELMIVVTNIGSGNYQLIVEDNGKGLPNDFEIIKIKTLGLMLVKQLSQQLYGKFIYKNENNPNFIVQFKDTQTRKLID
ncbi:MAG: hypothetical protein H6588_05720 [Flavobacteriales bacterium]|nr:hypothetical protein [Flavobacteriales bacterium]